MRSKRSRTKLCVLFTRKQPSDVNEMRSDGTDSARMLVHEAVLHPAAKCFEK
jgi:hypothetical protein